MSSYKLYSGERIDKKLVDELIRNAKSAFVRQAEDEYKLYCWACGTTTARLTCSHIVSVNDCQNNGYTEFAWDTDNLQLECNSCHLETESKKKSFDHHVNARYKQQIKDDFISRINDRDRI